MNTIASEILFVLTGLVGGFVAGYFLWRKHFQKLIQDGESLNKRELNIVNKQKNPFSVAVTPFVQKETTEGIFRDKQEVIIGHQYQLLIDGIPCFEPHMQIDKMMELKKIDFDNLEKFEKIAIRATDAFLSTLEKHVAKYIHLQKEVLILEGNTEE